MIANKDFRIIDAENNLRCHGLEMSDIKKLIEKMEKRIIELEKICADLKRFVFYEDSKK